MTSTIIARPLPVPAAAPEYFCPACKGWHSWAPCTTAAGDLFARVLDAVNSHRTEGRTTRRSRTAPLSPADANAALGQHLLAVVRAQDAAMPAARRAPRTLAQMRSRLAATAKPAGLYEEEQDACGVCGNWQCTCGQQPSGAAPGPAQRPAASGGSGQCSWCGGEFPGWNGGVCDACKQLG
ncbi:hypothetical protein [Streptomyces bauhiniae]|uniref:hypothetical protein n=1 Tax=Streptomyces bauhiniae TaxID=2340725 RepID=UPI0036640CBA